MFTLPGRLLAAFAATVLLASGCAPDTVASQAPPTNNPVTVPADDATAPEPVAEPVVHPVTVEPTPEPTTPAPTTPAPVEPTPELSEEPTPEPSVETPEVTEETPAPPPAPPALFEPGDEGEEVRDLQHRLLQIQWFEGKITGTYGDGTRLAVEGFQTKRGLPATGAVDQATLDALHKMTREPTKDEKHNVMRPGPAILAEGSRGDAVKDLQARLKQVAWYSAAVDDIYGPKTAEAVRGFQEKREIPVTGEVDQRTLDRLYAMTRKPTTDELNNVAPKPKPTTMTLDDRCLQGRVICISKSQRKLAWVIDGKIQSTMDVRFGSQKTPTRNGVFSVNWKSRDHHSKLYDSPMPYALFFSGGQAVHYSADFAARGYNGASHGCVNVRDKGAVAALFDAAREGDKVVVYK